MFSLGRKKLFRLQCTFKVELFITCLIPVALLTFLSTLAGCSMEMYIYCEDLRIILPLACHADPFFKWSPLLKSLIYAVNTVQHYYVMLLT